MHSIVLSLQPLWEKYKTELLLVSSSLIILSISIALIMPSNSPLPAPQIQIAHKDTGIKEKKYVVDVSGAVNKPDVYEVSPETRHKDILKIAGGLDKNADTDYIAQKINLAELVRDQEKIYIPFISDTMSAIDSPQSTNTPTTISINNASQTELESLPGIGKTTAEKIIKSRPYSSLDDLVSKKTLYQSVYEKIKNVISL